MPLTRHSPHVLWENLMTEAEENYAYWVAVYAEDLTRGRDPTEFGMKWMQGQITQWRETVESEAKTVSQPHI